MYVNSEFGFEFSDKIALGKILFKLNNICESGAQFVQLHHPPTLIKKTLTIEHQ